jgi:carboxyl-terminal processing protease
MRILYIITSILLFSSVTGCGTAQPLDEAAMERRIDSVIQIGLIDIEEVSLIDTKPDEIALKAMRGVMAADPSLHIEVASRTNKITLLKNKTIIKQMTPNEALRSNSRAETLYWAQASATLILKARKSSPPLRALGEEKLYKLFFKAALDGFDKFSRYEGVKKAGQHRAIRDGFGGLGLQLDDHPLGAVIINLAADAPAHQGGLQQGDIILEVDGIRIKGLSPLLRNKILHGPVGENLNLKINRENYKKALFFTLTRAAIVPNTVSLSFLAFKADDKEMAVIHIENFNSRTAKRVAEAIAEAKSRHTQPSGKTLAGLILDLRDNGGGLLNQAVDTADLFLRQGIITSADGRHPASTQLFSAEHGDIASELPLIILINGRTASAAEIVAAALQDNGRAILVGSSSFGKASIQKVIALPNGGDLILTWARFLAPSGYPLDKHGVLPNLCLTTAATPQEALNDSLKHDSAALKKAFQQRRAQTTTQKSDQTQCPWRPEHMANDQEIYHLGEHILGHLKIYRQLRNAGLPRYMVSRMDQRPNLQTVPQ